MNCRAARRRLPAYVGGELPAKRAHALGEHLERCPACRAEHDRLGQALTALRRTAEAPLTQCDPEAVWHAIRERLREQDLPHPAPGTYRWRTGRLWRRPVPVPLAAAVAALVAAIGLTLGLLLWPSSTPPGPARIARSGGLLTGGEAPLPPTPREYRPVPPPRFALENASPAEAGVSSYHLPSISHRDEAPGEEFVLEQVIYRPDENRRMGF